MPFVEQPHSDLWERIQQEPQLFQQLLLCSRTDDIDTLLQSALDYALQRVGAAEGFVALYEDDAGPTSVPRWCAVAGRSAEHAQRAEWPDLIRRVFSRGITAEALENWRRVVVLSPDSPHGPSMVLKRIHNVLAVPVGRQARGVLVLQNVSDERTHTPAFASEYIAFTQDFASLLSPFVDRAVLIAQTGDAATLGIVGAGRAMVDVRTNLRRHAMHSELPVLVVGPQGSGRTHVARAVHANSPRRTRPLLHEHCGAWSSDEASDLLFGVDGPRPQTGLLAAVDGGTLLLEEIDTLPGSTQAALVRFLETGTYRPRGATQDRRASVRLLATATTDAKVPVDLPKLRRDLHTRLSRGRITLPALAQRREDIPELLERLGRDTAARLMLAWPGMSEEAIGAAMLNSWKGNVAELANAVERAMQRTGGRTPIDKESLFGPPPEAPGVALVDAWLHKDIPIMLWTDAKDALHRAYLLRVLIAHDLSRAETARVLDVGTPHLQAMINRYDLRRELVILDAARARRLCAEATPEA